MAFEDLGVLSSERACFEDFGVVLVGALSRWLFPAAFAATPPDFAGFGAGLDTGLGTGVGAAGVGGGGGVGTGVGGTGVGSIGVGGAGVGPGGFPLAK